MILCGTSDFSKSQPERIPRDRDLGEKGEIFRERALSKVEKFRRILIPLRAGWRTGGEWEAGGWERRIFAGTKETTAPSSFYSCKDILQEEELA